jgi:hypothetical protein
LIDLEGNDCLKKGIRFKSILSVEEEKLKDILNQEHPRYGKPIFYAIVKGNLKAINYIIKKDSSVLQQLNRKNLNPFEYIFDIYVNNLNSTNPNGLKIAKSLKILNSIYKIQFKAQDDLSDEQLKLLTDYYYIEKSCIELTYNKTDEVFGLLQGYNIMLYKNLSQGIDNGQENPDQSQSNPFLSSALKTLDSIDNFDKPIEVGDEKLYIFNAKLKEHYAYFIFHVNNNKLTHISYCDGNRITLEDTSLPNYQYLKGGVRKFNIKTPIDFNQEFVDEFLKENSADVEMEVFYEKLRGQGLKLPSTSESHEFLTKPDEYSIPTKKQKKGNCPSKAITIVLRYMYQLNNPNMAEGRVDTESQDTESQPSEGRMVEGRLDTESQPSDSQNANPIYKEFKAQITISAVERLKESKEKLQEGGFGQEFIDYLTSQVDQILKEVSENADLKIAKDKSPEYSQLHEKIKLSAKSPFESKPKGEIKSAGEPNPVGGSKSPTPLHH